MLVIVLKSSTNICKRMVKFTFSFTVKKIGVNFDTYFNTSHV